MAGLAHFGLEALQRVVRDIIPNGALVSQRLNDVPEIALYLIDEGYPQYALDDDAIQRIMSQPLYWVFCWASGQVLARFLLDHPELVKGKRVVDFGAGSGVVAIAAAMAGAREVIACDLDPIALEACRINAEINDVQLVTHQDFNSVRGDIDIIVVADVLYDRNNMPWVAYFSERASTVLIADSRIKDFSVAPYRVIARADSDTVPDLDESASFRHVTVYQAGP